jgi:gluconate 2-dehydrogenase gamma chain
MKKPHQASSPKATPASELIPRRYSRAGFLKRAGVAGALTAASGSVRVKLAKAAKMPMAPAKRTLPAGAFSGAQFATLQAMAARIVPTDALGPGATEAGAANYINISLAGWPSARNSLATTFPGTSVTSSLPAYQAGLPAVDAYAQSKKGASFASLAATDQDAILTDMQNGVATGFTGGSATFFNLVRTHTLQGMLCDPYYGGNQSFIGWKWLRYPGIRMPVKQADQTLTPPLLNPMSAYDMPTYKSGPPTLKG